MVDLPQPEGPSSDRNSPRLTSRSTLRQRLDAVVEGLADAFEADAAQPRRGAPAVTADAAARATYFGLRSRPTPLLTKSSV